MIHLLIAATYFAFGETLQRFALIDGISGYYMSLFTGSELTESPFVKIDTGGHMTTLACSNCVNCKGNSSTFYNPKLSESSRYLRCVKMS